MLNGTLDVVFVQIYKLTVFNGFFCLPDKQSADRVFAHDGVEQFGNLLLAPYKWTLNIGEPKSPALCLFIVQIIDDLAY